MNTCAIRIESLKKKLIIFFDEQEHQLTFGNNKKWLFLIQHLKKLTVAGKLLRGGVFLRLIEDIKDDDYHIAMSLELIHTALLIHDDIMDQSSMRRNCLSMHAFVKKELDSKKLENSVKISESIALCMGDMLFFMVKKLLVNASSTIQEFIYKEWQAVCFGQINDLYYGAWDLNSLSLSIEDIIEVYKQKTAHYTFSLPLKLAALYQGYSSHFLELFYSIGEDLGIVYQIVDDYLDIFGQIEQTGKNQSQDIINKTKTIYLVMLFQVLSEHEKKEFFEYAHKRSSIQNYIYWVREKLDNYYIIDRVLDIRKKYEQSVQEGLRKLSTDKQNFLFNLLEYIVTRKN